MSPYRMLARNIIVTALGSFGIAVSPIVAQSEPPAGVLRLNSGDYVSGALANGPAFSDGQSSLGEAKKEFQLAWRHPQFESPFHFKISDIQAAYFPAPKDLSLAKGDFAIEFWGGDMLFGMIRGADDQKLQVSSERFGDLVVSRKRVRSLYRWDSGEQVAVIPCGSLDGWNVGEAKDAWIELGGQLHTTEHDATLARDIALPTKARISMELAWENKPNFVVALGVDPTNPATSANTALRIEVWDEQVVAVWEQDVIADLALIGSISDFNQELRLTIDLDQAASQATVISDQGKVLALLNLRPDDRSPFPGFWLQNISGNVSLQRLQVTRGDLAMTHINYRSQERIHLRDKHAVPGQWVGVEENVWLFQDGDQEERIPANEVLRVDFEGEPSGADAETATDSELVQLRTIEGMRLTGTLESINDDQLTLRPLALESSISVPINQIGRLGVMAAKASPPHSFGSTVARLETSNSRLYGRLVDMPPETLPSVLSFQPLGASAAIVRPDFSGRLVYQDPAPESEVAQSRTTQPPQPRQRPAGFWGALAGAIGGSSPAPQTGRTAMVLRSGEVIPCDVKRIDEAEVIFSSTMTTTTRVPQDRVRALQLLPSSGEPLPDQLRRERLLTVPRIRKDHPPTHLIVASNGDVLRCRLNRLTETVVEVETRLETIEIDRKVVAQILWLDSVSEESSQQAQRDSASDGGLPKNTMFLRALLRDGNQMSLVPRSVENAVIFGTNQLLGDVRVAIKDVRELWLGDAESLHVEESPYSTWRLTDAPEPMVVDDSHGERIPGVESPLVGKEAPDFTLELLGGERFTLSQQRGKVVVLDFWATWCGPCLQAMPVINQTVKAFDRDDILLVAVNLQETQEPILATLQRLKLEPHVALDIDGVAAARYQANAIPQTVVIDQHGTITRLFVGGGAKLGPQLTQAIEQLVDPEHETPAGPVRK